MLENENIYVCLHSLMYYHLNKLNIKEGVIKKIPNNFNLNKNFEAKLYPYDADILNVNNGLKAGIYTSGSVFIHGGAFSPPGCLHFKIKKEKDIHKLLIYIKSSQLGIHKPIKCFFILINDIKNENKSDTIQQMIEDYKKN